MKPKNLSKLPKRKVTVDDLLVSDDIQSMISILSGDLDEAVLIYKKKGEDDYLYASNCLPYSVILWMLEVVRNDIFNG